MNDIQKLTQITLSPLDIFQSFSEQLTIMNEIIMIFSIYRTKYIRISDVINDCFECLKFYVFRLEYSLNEYEQRQIPWTYKTFKRTIWITLNSWINILFISYVVLDQNPILSK